MKRQGKTEHGYRLGLVKTQERQQVKFIVGRFAVTLWRKQTSEKRTRWE